MLHLHPDIGHIVLSLERVVLFLSHWAVVSLPSVSISTLDTFIFFQYLFSLTRFRELARHRNLTFSNPAPENLSPLRSAGQMYKAR